MLAFLISCIKWDTSSWFSIWFAVLIKFQLQLALAYSRKKVLEYPSHHCQSHLDATEVT